MMKATLIGVVVLVVGVLGWFVWPTPYQVSIVPLNGRPTILRVHRMSGLMEYQTEAGWKTERQLRQEAYVRDLAAFKLADAEYRKLIEAYDHRMLAYEKRESQRQKELADEAAKARVSGDTTRLQRIANGGETPPAKPKAPVAPVPPE